MERREKWRDVIFSPYAQLIKKKKTGRREKSLISYGQ